MVLDSEFEYVTEGEEIERKEKLKSKWARLEAVVGSKARIKDVAKDIVQHFTQRLETNGRKRNDCMYESTNMC